MEKTDSIDDRTFLSDLILQFDSIVRVDYEAYGSTIADKLQVTVHATTTYHLIRHLN